jgi:hypothetical protein
MTTLYFTPAQLEEALEARRPWAERYDADRLAEHQKAEQAALKAFRTQLRDLAKLSYAELRERSKERYYSVRPEPNFPSCPRSAVARLDKSLAVVRQVRAKRVQVSKDGQWSTVHWLLTFDETITEDLCEAAP